MRDASPEMRKNLNALNAPEPLIACLEILHPDLDQAVYICNDSVDLQAFGHTYIACPFEYKRPDDSEQRTPMGSISIDNIGGFLISADGKEQTIAQWIDDADGGRNVKLNLFETIVPNPELHPDRQPVKEFLVQLDLSGLSVTETKITGQIGYRNPNVRPAVQLNFTRETAPGVF